MDWRLTESEREIDAKIRAKVREEVELDSAEAAKISTGVTLTTNP